MLALVRGLVYATLFVSVLLVLVPRRILAVAGVVPPVVVGAPQVIGLVLLGVGVALALWCVLTFALVGRGTPAPFDPPRQLVVAGPYRWVRNPMYIGAGLVLVGAASYYESFALAWFAGAFLLAAHLFVVLYEEPTLERTFGAIYMDYCQRVDRWIPKSASL